MKVRVIFEREKINKNFFSGWGNSYLVGEEVLFDTGEKSEYILNNLKMLNVNILDVKTIVISHNHWDHKGGLWQLLEINPKIKVVGCMDFLNNCQNRNASFCLQQAIPSQKIAEGIYTTGCIKTVYKGNNLEEQALVVRGVEGVFVLCGCAHSGILQFINEAKKIFPQEKVYAIIGGFHLINENIRVVRHLVEEVKKQGIKKIGPAHCTGFEAEQIFKEAYGNDFLNVKAGAVFEL